MNRKCLGLIGLARRAGRLLAGTETVLEAARRGRIRLAILAADLSPATRQKVSRVLGTTRILMASGRDELGAAAGRPGRGVFGVTDENLAEAIFSAWTEDRQAGTAEGGIDDSRQDPSP